MDPEFVAAVRQICDEKGIQPEQVYETVASAIASAYRKDFAKPGNKIEAEFDPESGKVRIFQVLEVVEEVENPDREITVDEAKKYKKKPKVDDTIQIDKEAPVSYGRIAAQTAKQVVIQKIREAERNVLFNEFKDKEGELLTGVVQQIEGRNIIINLGRANGILFPKDQIADERYYLGQRLKVYIAAVEETSKNPQILLSRTHPEMIHRLFELEVPEINSEAVEIKAIAREAGKRSKVAVSANQEGVDPVGSCVGQRGTRIQAVLAEIGEEKIDIILWDDKIEKYIENALSPAKIKSLKLDKKNQVATVNVAEDQLSLAIGREGQNVRLASKLTGWEVNIQKAEVVEAKKIQKPTEANPASEAETNLNPKDLKDIKTPKREVSKIKSAKVPKKATKIKKASAKSKTVKKTGKKG
ncbi:MAG TPA: transcription termination factor NusA [Patescibacteria group bacterium]|nr:transcription termination factor NusA [Patescibacteria group bacterium]